MEIRLGEASDRAYDNRVYPACEAYAKAKVEAFREKWDSYQSSEKAQFPELYRANAFDVEAYGDGGIDGGLERKESEIYQQAYDEKLNELTQQQDAAESSWMKAEFDRWSSDGRELGADAQEMRAAHYVVASEQAFPGEMDPVVYQESLDMLRSDDPDTVAMRERAAEQEARFEQRYGEEMAQEFKGASARYLEPAAWMKAAGTEEAHAQAQAELGSQQQDPQAKANEQQAEKAPQQAQPAAEASPQVQDKAGRVVGERVGERIEMTATDREAIRAALDDMEARGKSGVRVTGSEEFRRETAIEATARGMRVEGHKMTREDLQAARERRAELQQQQENVRTASTGEESLKARANEDAERVSKARSSQAAENKQQQQPQQEQQEAKPQQQQEDTLGIRGAETISKEAFQEGKQLRERELAEKANAERGQSAGAHGGQVPQAPAEQQRAPTMAERAQAQRPEQQASTQPMSERMQAQQPDQSYAAAKMSERAQAAGNARSENANRGNDDSRVARMRAAQQRGQEQLQSREQSHKRTAEQGHGHG